MKSAPFLKYTYMKNISIHLSLYSIHFCTQYSMQVHYNACTKAYILPPPPSYYNRYIFRGKQSLVFSQSIQIFFSLSSIKLAAAAAAFIISSSIFLLFSVSLSPRSGRFLTPPPQNAALKSFFSVFQLLSKLGLSGFGCHSNGTRRRLPYLCQIRSFFSLATKHFFFQKPIFRNKFYL